MGLCRHHGSREWLMVTYVYHMGRLILKSARPAVRSCCSDLPAPAVQSFTAYSSPIDGQTIASHRQRDRDLTTSDSYDKRDTPQSFKRAQDARRAANQRNASTPAVFT